jgi:hypothetical protein
MPYWRASSTAACHKGSGSFVRIRSKQLDAKKLAELQAKLQASERVEEPE